MLISRDGDYCNILDGVIGSMVKEVATGCVTVVPPNDAAGIAVDIAVAVVAVVVAVVDLFLCNRFLIAFMIGQDCVLSVLL